MIEYSVGMEVDINSILIAVCSKINFGFEGFVSVRMNCFIETDLIGDTITFAMSAIICNSIPRYI